MDLTREFHASGSDGTIRLSQVRAKVWASAWANAVPGYRVVTAPVPRLVHRRPRSQRVDCPHGHTTLVAIRFGMRQVPTWLTDAATTAMARWCIPARLEDVPQLYRRGRTWEGSGSPRQRASASLTGPPWRRSWPRALGSDDLAADHNGPRGGSWGRRLPPSAGHPAPRRPDDECGAVRGRAGLSPS